MKKKQALYFLLQNNTSGTIPVSLLNPGTQNNIANAHTRYLWDITGFTFSPLTFSIQAKWSSGDAYSSFSGSLAAASSSALVAALNNLNIGAFWIETSGPNTYVATWNDRIIYGSLTVGATTSQVDWVNSTNTASGSLVIRKNLVIQVNDLNPGITVGSIMNLVDGDSIKVDVTASPAEITDFIVTQVLAVPPFTQIILHTNSVAAGGTDTYTFVVNTAYTYTVQWGPAI
jgi:hypothetical protein